MEDNSTTLNAGASAITATQAAPALPPQPAPAPAPAFSLADLEAKVYDDTPQPLDMFMPDGKDSGVTLLILSDQAPSVRRQMEKLLDDERRAEQFRAAQARVARPGNEPIASVAETVERQHKLVALRVAGWTRGLTDPVTQENKLRLLKVAPGFVDQILGKAREMADFTPASPTT
jgi:hypothetical protein